jgi:hypothetical protein
MTPAGWSAARNYGIRTILDLRSEPECAADPLPHPDFTHSRLSLFDHFDGDPDYRSDLIDRVAHLDAAGKHRVFYGEALDLDASRFAEAFGVLADADGGAFFHCVGGKDRTGVLAALLLRLVDVSAPSIEADYIRSEERLPPRAEIGAPRGVINEVLAEVERRHGSVAGYLLRAGVPDAQLVRIKDRFTASAQPRSARGSRGRRSNR